MGGFFGVVSHEDCVGDLFYGTDYHSHLGTRRGGLAVRGKEGITRYIHDISNAQFRSKFDDDIRKMRGETGIGVISDFEDQPLIINSHLGVYAIVTVGVIRNADEIVAGALKRKAHFSEMSCGEINPTELVAALINQGSSFVDGLRIAQEHVDGSCSVLLLTRDGVYASRDRYGRTPVITGSRKGAWAVCFESSALPNLGYEFHSCLGPGEIVLITPEGIEQKSPPGPVLQICSFLWVYYGYPSSSYEGINVEEVRNRCGAALARGDDTVADLVSGIPDSGTAHAIGYANYAHATYGRPFAKYTPTWPRSFMPQIQSMRDLVARMKLIPVPEIIRGRTLMLCDDSLVRGTQLKDTVQRLFQFGAAQVHLRFACPPLLFGCRFLNFSRSRSEYDLAARSAVKEIEDCDEHEIGKYARHGSEQFNAMVERMRLRLGITSLGYQKLDDLVTAIGLPREKLCTYCWDGCDGRGCPSSCS